MKLILTLVLYVALDLLWVGGFAKGFIARQVGPYLSPKADWLAAILFYLIFASGLWYFAVNPACSTAQAFLNGAFFGLVTYGTYELVNRALIANWPWKLVVVDMAYGVVACSVVSGVAHALSRLTIPLLLTAFVFLAGCQSAMGQARTEYGDYPISPVEIRNVAVTDDFWLPVIERVQKTTIDYAIRKWEEEGRLESFLIAGGLKPGPVRDRFPFDDSDYLDL